MALVTRANTIDPSANVLGLYWVMFGTVEVSCLYRADMTNNPGTLSRSVNGPDRIEKEIDIGLLLFPSHVGALLARSLTSVPLHSFPSFR
jgi:hypothetical protein